MKKGDKVQLLVAPFCRGRYLDETNGVARVLCPKPEGMVHVRRSDIKRARGPRRKKTEVV